VDSAVTDLGGGQGEAESRRVGRSCVMGSSLVWSGHGRCGSDLPWPRAAGMRGGGGVRAGGGGGGWACGRGADVSGIERK
jgi:hypothetical protein